jgi:hypothetical protein
VPSPSRVSDEAGLSALCKAVAPEQVHVVYCASDPLPFHVEWNSELGPIVFAGPTPDDAAERALNALHTRRLPIAPSSSLTAKPLVRFAPPPAAPSPTEPLAQTGWAEAMRERIQQIEERKPARRPSLRLVRR